MPNDSEQLSKLVELLREAIRNDVALREKFDIGDKFRFVRDRLTTMLTQLEEKLPTLAQENTGTTLSANDSLVYVYLYNAQGVNFRTWLNMLNPKLFYEYSINRPIYPSQEAIDSLLRTKTNKVQHAYITVAVPKDKIIQQDAKDAGGNPIIKVKEGTLQFDKMISFTHNEQSYHFNLDGELVKNNN